jgi:hypothetical protein
MPLEFDDLGGLAMGSYKLAEPWLVLEVGPFRSVQQIQGWEEGDGLRDGVLE